MGCTEPIFEVELRMPMGTIAFRQYRYSEAVQVKFSCRANRRILEQARLANA